MGVRLNQIHVKMSEAELKQLDRKCGTLTRSAYIRLLIDNAQPIKVKMGKK